LPVPEVFLNDAMIIDKKFIRENQIIRLAVFFIFTVLVALFFPRNKISSFNYEVGSVWLSDDVVAPFTFPIYKSDEDRSREQAEASSKVLPVFRRKPALVDTTKYNMAFRLLKTQIDSIRHQAASDTVLLSGKKKITFIFDGTPLGERESMLLVRSALPTRQSPDGTGLLDGMQRRILTIVKPILSDGVINIAKSKQASADIVLRLSNDREENVTPAAKFRDEAEAETVLAELLEKIYSPATGDANDTLATAFSLAKHFLTPTIVYDAIATQADRDRASANVSIGRGSVAEGERIIARGEKVTLDVRNKLESFIKAKAFREGRTGEVLIYIGKILTTIIISALFVIYLFLFRDKVFYDNLMLMVICVIILFELFLTWGSLKFENISAYGVPVALASILLTIIFDSRVGFFGTITLALLAATIRGNDFPFALASIFAGGLGVFTVRDIRKRSQIFLSVLYVFLGYTVSILAFSFARLSSLKEILTDLQFAAISSILCFFVYPILLVIEKSFGLTTDLTLVELSDVNHPLLKDMAMNAPGTYHHTLQVSLLSEQAAEAIGANSLLCRVGSYFHDIGKIAKSEYFTENQGQIRSDEHQSTSHPVTLNAEEKHKTINPHLSSIVIASHVRDGLALGRQRNLPEKVLDFIPQHHGTTVIHYFYDKAVQDNLRIGNHTHVNPADFRYPGPKPQSREAGIVMLADGVEASVRSITAHTEQKISQMIETIVRKRVEEEQQFSECPLTLAEIEIIKQSFLKTLIAAYHSRIKYPGQRI
jgi:putative nucleotidyltransferase with HDIG domain